MNKLLLVLAGMNIMCCIVDLLNGKYITFILNLFSAFICLWVENGSD